MEKENEFQYLAFAAIHLVIAVSEDKNKWRAHDLNKIIKRWNKDEKFGKDSMLAAEILQLAFEIETAKKGKYIDSCTAKNCIDIYDKNIKTIQVEEK